MTQLQMMNLMNACVCVVYGMPFCEVLRLYSNQDVTIVNLKFMGYIPEREEHNYII